MDSARTEGTPARVAIGVATRRRPAGLERLLESFARLEVPAWVVPMLIVVDNDEDGSAHETFELGAERLGWEASYSVQPDPGIPAARRALVERAIAMDAAALVFIDDDEEAEPGWLAALTEHWRASGADAVAGPVRRLLPDGAPAWARSADLFDRTGRIATGTRLAKAYTGNALVSRAILDAIDTPFDDSFRFTGSSDLHFFLRVARAGYRIEWCEEALANEHVPSARITWGWYLRRGYRSGAGDAIARRLLDSSPKSLADGVLRGTARLGQGIAYLPAATVSARARAKAAQRLASGVGTFAGLAGRNYDEYTRESAA